MSYGKKVETLDDLWDLALSKRSIIRKSGQLSGRATPAAFVMSMHAFCVLRLLRGGMWVYEKQTKPENGAEQE